MGSTQLTPLFFLNFYHQLFFIMFAAVTNEREKSLRDHSLTTHIQDFLLNPDDLSGSAKMLLCLILERLEKLVSFTKTMEEKEEKKDDLESLLHHMVSLLELPNSADDLSEVSRQIERIIQESNFRTKHKAEFARLTHREKEVLTLLASGCSNKEVAHHLSNSLETIKHHRKIIKSKLSLNSTAELVQYGQAFNLV